MGLCQNGAYFRLQNCRKIRESGKPITKKILQSRRCYAINQAITAQNRSAFERPPNGKNTWQMRDMRLVWHGSSLDLPKIETRGLNLANVCWSTLGINSTKSQRYSTNLPGAAWYPFLKWPGQALRRKFAGKFPELSQWVYFSVHKQ